MYTHGMACIHRRLILSAVLCFAVTVAAASREVNDWLYILTLDNVTVGDIAASGYDLVVMDYSASGDEDGEFTAAEIDVLHDAGMLAVSYFSIGEAEDYRFYWREEWETSPPSWLGPVNPDWDGNYKVRYWSSGWQAILFGTPDGANRSYLDRIIDQGFDGVYLDIVDAYEYWSEENPEMSRLQARQEMKTLLERIRTYARVARGVTDFRVIPQNAAGIVWDDDGELDALGLAYLDLCDGIGAEDTWFDETDPQSAETVAESVTLLDIFRSTGGDRWVLCVDYIWDVETPSGSANLDRYNAFHSIAREHGFLPYAAARHRDLSEIVTRMDTTGFLYAQPRPDPVRIRSWFRH